ncbi:MAG: anthranilate phosphoribosyltransferase [Candidatus Melainabacteria bacterium]|nr:anthranilate phosphoribosyltransferase [Candidatus Melainabacteria bacterium]
MSINNVISKLRSKVDLNEEDLSIIFHNFEEKNINSEDIKNLVLSWREKGESAFEICHLVELINKKQGQSTVYKNTIDMCGTGGDKLNTFNISTLAAIVTSSCGSSVIKHSGRSTTSTTGSVDILSQFKFDIDTKNEIKEHCFKKTNLMFTSSKILRELFADVKKICQEANIPGFVNLLGPLTNPYKTSHHILGVSNLKWGTLMASSLKSLGSSDSLVLCCRISENIFMDELSFCGDNYLWKLVNGVIKEEVITPSDFNMKIEDVSTLVIKDKAEGKTIFEDILKGNLSNKTTSKATVIALNTGAALYLTKKVKSIFEGYNIALQHIKSGRSWEHFQNFLNCMKGVHDFTDK